MLPQLQAERQMAAIEAVALPHMKDHDRQQTLSRYTHLISGKPVRARSLQDALNRMPQQRKVGDD